MARPFSSTLRHRLYISLGPTFSCSTCTVSPTSTPVKHLNPSKVTGFLRTIHMNNDGILYQSSCSFEFWELLNSLRSWLRIASRSLLCRYASPWSTATRAMIENPRIISAVPLLASFDVQSILLGAAWQGARRASEHREKIMGKSSWRRGKGYRLSRLSIVQVSRKRKLTNN